MNKPKTQQTYRSDNFFEAFRELGNQTAKTGGNLISDTAADIVTQLSGGIPKHKQFSGELRPNQFLDIETEIRRRNEESIQKERLHFQHLRRQEQLVYSRKQEEIRLQIKAIQEELKKVIVEAAGLAKEIEVAAIQEVVDPGVYHLNFFDKLREMLVLLRKKIADSRTWMHTVNVRAKQRSFFWAQVGASGTKFMLSHERYMATQAG